MPKANHIVIAGLGKVGTEIARFLRELSIPIVASDQNEAAGAALPDLPFVCASGAAALEKMNAPSALSVNRATMQSLPWVFQYPLYKQQAQRLLRKLARVQVKARIEPWPSPPTMMCRRTNMAPHSRGGP